MEHNLYIRALIFRNWHQLLLAFCFYLGGEIADNLRKRVVDFRLHEIVEYAHAYSGMRELTFYYCSKEEYAHYLFSLVQKIIMEMLCLRLLKLFLNFLALRFRSNFQRSVQLDTLVLMLHHYVNLPELAEPEHKPETFHEAARDFSELYSAIFMDIISPTVNIIVDLLSSNFHFSFTSILIPIFPLFFTFKLVVKLANKSRSGMKKVMRGETERSAFITSLPSRRLLMKSYNSCGYELSFIKSNVRKNGQESESNQKYSRIQRLIERFTDVYREITVNYFKIRFLLFEKYSIQHANDYSITIQNIYKLEKSFIDFSSRTDIYFNAFDLVKTVFNYEADTPSLRSIKEVNQILALNSSICQDVHCERLSLRDINFSLNGQRIFKDLSLELTPGFYLIEGRSGIGKSTLFKLIGGIYSPENGSILLDGRELNSVIELRSVVTIVHQQDAPINNLSLEEHITYGLPWDDERYAIVCDICEITFQEQNVAKLSGGEHERVALARGLYRARDRTILLLDESTNGLDMALEEEILQGIKQYCAKHSIICVLISHRNSCRAHVDSVLNMEDLENTIII